MRRSIRFFGGTTRGQVTIENGHSETWAIDRDVWFDRDIDGRWLVCAERRDAINLPWDQDGPGEMGSIVVRDPSTIAFIEMLGELIANPAWFRDEPTFPGPPERDGT